MKLRKTVMKLFTSLALFLKDEIKGTLDKSNIYLFISSSIKDCKSN